jgi:hypothetical protein
MLVKYMSYTRALKTIHLQPTDRVAQQETLDHPLFMQELVGFNPWNNPLQAYVDAYRSLDVDWIFGLPRHAMHFEPGESSREGSNGIRYTEWGLSGSAWRENYPFHDIDSVLNYEPEVSGPRYNNDSFTGLRADQALMGDSTIVSGLYTINQYSHLLQHYC